MIKKNSAEPAVAHRTRLLQEQLLSRLLKLSAFLSLLAFIPSAWLSVREGLWVVLGLDTLACSAIFILAFSKGIAFRFKVISLLALCYVLGTVILFFTGPFGAGHLFIFAFIFITALFASIRWMVASNILAILTHAGIALAAAMHWVAWSQSIESVLVISVNFILISLVLSYAANFLIQGYARAVSEEEKHRVNLEDILYELEHRVKNNLQVISSLIKLRSRSSQSSPLALGDIQESLSAIAMVHQLLYRRDDLYLIEIHALLEALTGYYQKIYRHLDVRLDWQGGEAEINADHAVSLGILANEIVTNAVKHAFPDGRRGRITISGDYQAATRQLVLCFADNGCGYSHGAQAQSGIGTKIIQALCRQLQTELQVDSTNGVQYRMVLILPPQTSRAEQ